MQQQQWKARWTEHGKPQELVFDSTTSRGIARIDFRLQAQLAGFHPPEHVDLEEVSHNMSPVRLI